MLRIDANASYLADGAAQTAQDFPYLGPEFLLLARLKDVVPGVDHQAERLQVAHRLHENRMIVFGKNIKVEHFLLLIPELGKFDRFPCAVEKEFGLVGT